MFLIHLFSGFFPGLSLQTLKFLGEQLMEATSNLAKMDPRTVPEI